MATDRDLKRTDESVSLRAILASTVAPGEGDVHEIDFGDIMISEQVIGYIGQATRELLQRYVPNLSQLDSRHSDLIGAIDNKAFWLGESGSLVLTVEIVGNRHFFKIPRELWETRRISKWH
ncbi:hypothetical protein dsat_0962 [Alkalidesulfovibrio alkalitolerans DSM 16529]|uniref:Uncharacterized protein n=1 Tax=Alkalidesulfovibrio alkalitolerans DSM 16529 TaxID=1121439 RepID=S7UH97_9BACT|nr:hypothetical protein [Alkalidesulfovibrio alkalitolerans]EPR31638.1 hypothetical protein dsat_0962 [Alkalidesulfovibrio alkalitolerans DSM 16529]